MKLKSILVSALLLSTGSSAYADYLTDNWTWAGSRLDVYNHVLDHRDGTSTYAHSGYLYNRYKDLPWMQNLFNHAMNNSNKYFSLDGERILENKGTGTASTNMVDYDTDTANYVFGNSTYRQDQYTLNYIYIGSTTSVTNSDSETQTASLSNFQGGWITEDIRNEWDDGWTGKGINIAVADYFGSNTSILYDGRSTSTSNGIDYSTRNLIQLSHGDIVSWITGDTWDLVGTSTVKTNAYQCNVNTGLSIETRRCKDVWTRTFTMEDRHGIAREANVSRYDVLSNQSYLISNPNGISINLTNYDILNLSLGQSNPDSSTSTFWKNTFNNASDSSNGTVIVKAAGNSNITSQQGSINNALVASDYADSLLIVGATASETLNSKAAYSNTAGTLKDYFVVDSGYVTSSVVGTSFAAPRVAGKAALIMQKFETSAEDTVKIIKKTATDLGATGIDAVFGHGKVNITKAMSPVGNLN